MKKVWIYSERIMYKDGPKRQAEHETGRKLLRRALREIYGLSYDDCRIALGTHGKPELADHPEIYFNISHCEGLAVCAVGGLAIGIDVEKVREYKDSLARKVLNEAEQRQLLASGERTLFFRFWTLKESYVKAVGCGITLPLREIGFLLGNQIRCSVPGYTFWQRQREEYVLAVCTAGEAEVVMKTDITCL